MLRELHHFCRLHHIGLPVKPYLAIHVNLRVRHTHVEITQVFLDRPFSAKGLSSRE